MKNLLRIQIIVILTLLAFYAAGFSPVSSQTATVRGILFFSPSCPHCHKVINEVLPPLFNKYGDNINIVNIDVGTQDGQALYKAAIDRFEIPDDRIGVPTLVLGGIVLVGSSEIPDQLPALIEKGLAVGGVDWPEIPGLNAVLSKQANSSPTQADLVEVTATPKSTSQEQAQTPVAPQSGFAYKFAQDPIGNTIAVVVLVGMLLSVIWTIVTFLRGNTDAKSRWPSWAVPVLVVIGLIVSGYLSYVEISQANAICGPVGNCNAVQRSSYATLFGVLPVGVLGFIGYLLIGAAWLLQQFGPESIRKFCTLAAWGFAWVGILFSIYLTFLEPFVIGATCAWCITSAIVITLILLATTGPAIKAMSIEEDDSE